MLLPPPLSYGSQAATGGQCLAIAGGSGSAANQEEDGQEVAPRVLTQGSREQVDEPHQQREEGGYSVHDGDEERVRLRGVAPPIPRVVSLGFAALLPKNLPSPRWTMWSAASTPDRQRSGAAPMTSARRGRAAPTSKAFGRGAPRRGRGHRRLPAAWEAGTVRGCTRKK